MTKSFRLIAAAAAAFASSLAVAQSAAEFPNRAVRFVVGFPPGGSSDVSARIVAEKMSEEWKQPVIVENKPGAGATIAAAFVAAAPADGYTLLHLGPGTHAITGALYRNLSYDPVKSFTGVGQIATSPFVVVVAANSPFSTMRELLEFARSRAEGVSYGSSGSGAGPHLVTEVVASSAGVKFLHVPFKGAAPATAAAVAGQVNFATVDSASAIAHIKGGRLRALAVTTANRSSLYEGVPTVAESGVSGFAYPSSVGLSAPAGTPPDIVQKINGALNRALANPGVQARLSGLGFDAAPMTPAQFDSFVAAEVPKYAKVVRELGLKLD